MPGSILSRRGVFVFLVFLFRIGLFLFGFFLIGRDDLFFEWVDPGIAPGWTGILNVLLRVDFRVPLIVFHNIVLCTSCKYRACGPQIAFLSVKKVYPGHRQAF